MSDKPDWERIEVEYRANRLSIREIGRAHGVSDSAIRKKAKREGWERDLSNKVRERTQDKVVRNQVRTPNAREEDMVEEIADRTAQVVEVHRQDAQRLNALVSRTMGELEDMVHNRQTLGELIEQIGDDEEVSPKAIEAFRHAVSMENIVGMVSNLTRATEKAHNVSRDAHGIEKNDRSGEKDVIGEIIEHVQDTSRGIDGYE